MDPHQHILLGVRIPPGVPHIARKRHADLKRVPDRIYAVCDDRLHLEVAVGNAQRVGDAERAVPLPRGKDRRESSVYTAALEASWAVRDGA